ncbi:MAG TPA: carboxypeptidase-like regulatory domain-containing protein [Pyrinomonadaceae bacterium]|jgi:hypothetical protein
MKIFLILTLVFIGFAVEASAQVCGQYTTTLIIKSDDNKSIENALVQLVALEKDETKNKTFVRDENERSKFSITFNEGHLILGKYKIIVSADGFETSEKEIGFPHCKHQTFEFKLKAAKAQNQAVLAGTITDQVGAAIQKAKIKISGNNNQKFVAETNDNGVYKISLPEGVYSIEFNASGCKSYKLKNYRTRQFETMRLDIVLYAIPTPII